MNTIHTTHNTIPTIDSAIVFISLTNESAATVARFKVTNMLFIASLLWLTELAISTHVCHCARTISASLLFNDSFMSFSFDNVKHLLLHYSIWFKFFLRHKNLTFKHFHSIYTSILVTVLTSKLSCILQFITC